MNLTLNQRLLRQSVLEYYRVPARQMTVSREMQANLHIQQQLLGEAQKYRTRLNRAINCAQLNEQLEQDKTALKRQQDSIEAGNTELRESEAKKEQAEKDALTTASNFFVDS